MDLLTQSESVRDIVVDTFSKLGKREDCLDCTSATDILCEGYRVGKRYELDGLRAIWFSDRDVIVFYRENGGLLRAVSVSGRSRPKA